MSRFAWLSFACVILAACGDTRGRRDGAVVFFDSGPRLDAGRRDAGSGFDAGPRRDAGSEVAPLRIVGTVSMGRLEIQHEGVWGTVCDDAFDSLDATVACRQLGFTSGTSYTAGGGVEPIWLDDLACTGSEGALSQCVHPGWAVHNCSHTEDVGVTCL
jgi:hypothetical protein